MTLGERFKDLPVRTNLTPTMKLVGYDDNTKTDFSTGLTSLLTYLTNNTPKDVIELIDITNSSNDYSSTTSIPSYSTSKIYLFQPNINSTGDSTLDINSIGSLPIKEYTTSLVNKSDLKAANTYSLIYKGTYWLVTGGSGGGSGEVTSVSSGTGMSFSTITTTGSVSIDTTKVPYLSSGFSSGLLRWNGSAWVFDNSTYLTTISGITVGGDLSGTLPNPTVTKINGTSLSGLTTGLLKNHTSTGVPTIAISGTDYAPATTGTSILQAFGGGFASVTVGSGLSFAASVLSINDAHFTGEISVVSGATTLDNLAVIGKVLTGLSITGSTLTSTDTILQAFGKVQNQINGLVGGTIYQGVWNATTNSPTLTSSTGTKGYYYVVSVAGSTNLDGITDWKIGDWAIYNGTIWNKVDNTDAISSFNGSLGGITYTPTGTVNRLTVTGAGGLAPTFDISVSYIGQSTITTLGTITTGTWNGTTIGDTYISSSTNWNTAYTNRITSLTTTGSSGAATLISNTLNIPTYTLAGLGGVSSVSGTTNRITSTGGTTPIIDISATFEALLGKVANPLSQFASTTSAQLAGVISDETGTGVLVFNTSPALTTPTITNGTVVGTFTLAQDATSALQAVTLQQMNNAITGLDAKPTVQYCSTSALPANTYSNGSSGVGATLTGTSNTPLIVDGVTILLAQVGQRILVTGESTQANNGWYTITQQGTVAVSPYILTRATESDQGSEIGAGYLTSVIANNSFTPGSSNNGKVFISVAADPFTVGTTTLTFSQVGSTYLAGTGLTLSGSTFAIDSTVATLIGSQALTNKTYNGLTLTSTTGTFTLTNAKIFSVTNTLTLSGTDSSTLNIGAGGTLGSNAYTSTAYLPIASPAYTGTLTVGTLGYSDTGILASHQSSTNSYNQMIMQNTSSGSVASTSYIVSNNSGTSTTFFGEFGINSSGFTGSGSLNLASASYLTSTSGDLVIGTTTSNSIRFLTNSATTDSLVIGTTGNSVFGGGVTLVKGTTSLAPLTFTLTSAALLTSATIGSMENDANGILYYTHATNERGIIPSIQFLTLTSDYTLTSTIALQKVFNSSTNGAITVASNTTYHFTIVIVATGLAATSGTISFGLGGTATFTNNYTWNGITMKQSALSTPATAQLVFDKQTVTGNSNILTTNTGGTAFQTIIIGQMRINAGGTIIPQIALGIAATATIDASSRFTIIAIGTDTVKTIGNWS